MMATEPFEADEPEDDTLDLPIEEEESPPEQNDEPEDEDDGPIVIDLDADEEEPQDQHSNNLRRLRDQVRALERDNSDLRKASSPKPVELGPKPTLESCEYDEEAFDAALEKWHDRRTAVDRQTAEQARAQQAVADKQRQTEAAYLEKAARLQVKARITPEEYRGFEQSVADDVAGGEHSDAIKALMHGYIEDVPLITFALGRNPKRRAAIGAIDDPVKKFLALYDLSKELKTNMTTRRKAPPAPEQRVSGSGRVSRPDYDKELEKLEAQAEKSGNRNAVIAFKRKMKEKTK